MNELESFHQCKYWPISPFSFSLVDEKASCVESKDWQLSNKSWKIGLTSTSSSTPPDKAASNNTFLPPIASAVKAHFSLANWPEKKENQLWSCCYCKVRRTLGDFSCWLFLLRRIGPARNPDWPSSPRTIFSGGESTGVILKKKTMKGHWVEEFTFCEIFFYILDSDSSMLYLYILHYHITFDILEITNS